MRARMLAGALLLGGLISLASGSDASAQNRNRGGRSGDDRRGPRYSDSNRGYRGGDYGQHSRYNGGHAQPYRYYGNGYRYAPAPRRYYSRPYPSPYYYPYGGYYNPYYYYPDYYAPYSAPAPYPYYGRPGVGLWFRF